MSNCSGDRAHLRGGSRRKSGAVVAEAEGNGLGGDPGPDAELLCGLWGSEVRQGGVATAAQSLCAAEQGEAAN